MTKIAILGTGVVVSGNHADARKKVTDILKQFNWTDIIDLGDITTARGTEMMLPVWIRTWGALKNGHFGFKITRLKFIFSSARYQL